MGEKGLPGKNSGIRRENGVGSTTVRVGRQWIVFRFTLKYIITVLLTYLDRFGMIA